MTQKTPPDKSDPALSEEPLKEITRERLSETLGAALVAKEAVHPLSGVEELVNTRIAPDDGWVWDKHCYGWYTPEDKTTPKVVVYVKLLHLTEKDGKIENSALPGNIQDILEEDVRRIEKPNAAIFYTITNISKQDNQKPVAPNRERPSSEQPKTDTQDPPQKPVAPGEKPESPGEKLIKAVATHLQSQGIKCFSTLSPLRSGIVPDDTSNDKAQESTKSRISGFSKWLSEFLTKEENTPVLTEEERKFLSEAMQGGSYDKLTKKEHKAVAPLMKRLAYHYITNVKDVGGKNPKDPKDFVARFHLGNGAEVANIHYITPRKGATPSDKEGAYGIMVNYRYDLDKIDARKEAYKKRWEIAVDPKLERDYQKYIAQLKTPRVKVKSVIPDEKLRNTPPYEAYNR